MFLYKYQFLLIFCFLSIPIDLWESTAAILRQSAAYVFPLPPSHYVYFVLVLCIIFNCSRMKLYAIIVKLCAFLCTVVTCLFLRYVLNITSITLDLIFCDLNCSLFKIEPVSSIRATANTIAETM